MTVAISTDPVVAQFEAWDRAARGTAYKRQGQGDPFGSQLAAARAKVYAEAAHTAQLEQDVADLAAELMSHAVECSVREASAPLGRGFDEAALSYARARAWQLCALHVDPTLHEVQERWS